MTRFSHDDDDDKLVSFLTQYRPSPPPPSLPLEQELMKRIENEPLDSKYSSHLFWVLPSAVVATLLMTWVSHDWFRSSPQIATNSQDLESFLIDSWAATTEDATEDTSYTSGLNNSNSYWLTFADYQLETNSSNPLTY